MSNTPPKVLVVRSVLSDMGPGTQPLFLAEEMRKRGIDTVFISSGGVFLPEVSKRGFTVEIEPGLAPNTRRALLTIRTIWRISGLIKKHKPDVIHGHNAASTILAKLAGLCAGRNIPCATSVRGVEERKAFQIRNQIWRITPGRLLAVCQNTRTKLQSYGVPADKITVTYNGVDTQKFDPERVDANKIRTELSLQSKVVVGTVGAITGHDLLDGPGKGQHNLVKAVAKLVDKYPDLHVLLVGDGNYRIKVEELAKQLGLSDRVTFTGRRFDTPELLAAMDIYCLASIYGEFFPNSILEAMSMALPWVGSDIAGLSELTAGNEAGWVSAVGDVDALAKNLTRLLEDQSLRVARGLRGKQEVLNRFSIQSVCDNVIECYRIEGLQLNSHQQTPATPAASIGTED